MLRAFPSPEHVHHEKSKGKQQYGKVFRDGAGLQSLTPVTMMSPIENFPFRPKIIRHIPKADSGYSHPILSLQSKRSVNVNLGNSFISTVKV